MKERFEILKKYKEDVKGLDRKTFIIEALLDKMLDYNDYKKLFSILIIEMRDNKTLLDVYMKNMEEMTNFFIEFCNTEGFEEYIKVSNKEFGVFINSLILGTYTFNMYNDTSYRDMLRTMISSYFKDINLFKNK